MFESSRAARLLRVVGAVLYRQAHPWTRAWFIRVHFAVLVGSLRKINSTIWDCHTNFRLKAPIQKRSHRMHVFARRSTPSFVVHPHFTSHKFIRQIYCVSHRVAGHTRHPPTDSRGLTVLMTIGVWLIRAKSCCLFDRSASTLTLCPLSSTFTHTSCRDVCLRSWPGVLVAGPLHVPLETALLESAGEGRRGVRRLGLYRTAIGFSGVRARKRQRR